MRKKADEIRLRKQCFDKAFERIDHAVLYKGKLLTLDEIRRYAIGFFITGWNSAIKNMTEAK